MRLSDIAEKAGVLTDFFDSSINGLVAGSQDALEFAIQSEMFNKEELEKNSNYKTLFGVNRELSKFAHGCILLPMFYTTPLIIFPALGMYKENKYRFREFVDSFSQEISKYI